MGSGEQPVGSLEGGEGWGGLGKKNINRLMRVGIRDEDFHITR